MKKIIISLIAASVVFSGAAYAESQYDTISMYWSKIEFAINGQSLDIGKDSMMYEGTVYVPLRALGEALEAKVDWDEEKQLVTFDFLSNDIASLSEQGKKGVYQYIAISNKSVFNAMADKFTKDNYSGLTSEIKQFDELGKLAENLNDQELSGIYHKLAAAVEIIRTGWVTKRYDDYGLAWMVFEDNAGQLSHVLGSRLSASP